MGKGGGKGSGKGGENCFQSLRNLVCCVIFLIVIGPVLIGIGVWQLELSFSDGRAGPISEYDSQVDAWTSHWRSTFDHGVIAVHWANGASTMQFTRDTSKDPINDQNKSDGNSIKTYEALKFHSTIFGPVGNMLFAFFIRTSPTTYNTVNLGTFPATKTSRRTVSESSSSLHSRRSNCHSKLDGSCNDHDCDRCTYTVKSGLSEVCVSVRLSNGRADPYNEFSSNTGCRYNGGSWSNTVYKEGYTGNTAVYVRHYKDPLIYLENLTHGSLNFGLTQSEQFTLGVVLISIGCIFSIPIVMLCCCIMRRRRAHKDTLIVREEVHHYHDNPSQIQQQQGPSYGDQPGYQQQPQTQGYAPPPQPYPPQQQGAYQGGYAPPQQQQQQGVYPPQQQNTYPPQPSYV